MKSSRNLKIQYRCNPCLPVSEFYFKNDPNLLSAEIKRRFWFRLLNLSSSCGGKTPPQFDAWLPSDPGLKPGSGEAEGSKLKAQSSYKAGKLGGCKAGKFRLIGFLASGMKDWHTHRIRSIRILSEVIRTGGLWRKGYPVGSGFLIHH